MEDNNITQKDFELFLQNKKIDTSNNENNKKMFDSFLVFQKFMNAMLSTTTLNKNNEQNDNEENKNIKEEKKEENKIISDKKKSENNFEEEKMNLEEEKKEEKENKKILFEKDNFNYNLNYYNKREDMFQNNIENKQHLKYINYDEIPIKTVDNFVELVEKNLAELKSEPKRGKSERKKNN